MTGSKFCCLTLLIYILRIYVLNFFSAEVTRRRTVLNADTTESIMSRLPSLATTSDIRRIESVTTNHASASSTTGPTGLFEVAVHDSMDVIIQKLRRATQALAVTENVELSR